MKVLRLNSTGPEVRKWQIFLSGLGFQILVDGKFGTETERASKQFQQNNGLKVDGVVGEFTFRKAFDLGFNFLTDPLGEGETTINWPPKPNFPSLNGLQNVFSVFGKFDFQPIPNNPNGEIKILGSWEQDNIVNVKIPTLSNISGAPANGQIRFHRKAVPQLEGLFNAWENAGLSHLIETWSGSFFPRFMRGSADKLSNHSFGSAFDINVAWNGLGVTPALVGKKGSVRQLVPLANQFGFFWGGHFNNRLDGMHFEVAKIV